MSMTRLAALTNKEFSANLFMKVLEENPKGNVFISPFSVFSALSMLYSGASGETARQIKNVLHTIHNPEEIMPVSNQLFQDLNSNLNQYPNKFKVANAIFPAFGLNLKKEYLEQFQKGDFGELIPVDFSDTENTKNAINAWVDGITQGKIKDLISPGILDAITRIVLVNAVYQYAKWMYEFEEHLNSEQTFFSPTGKVETSFMTQKSKFGYFETPSVQILEMFHDNQETSMIFAIPKPGFPFAEVTHLVEESGFDFFTDNLYEREIKVYIPKFKIEFGIDLEGLLGKMGMESAMSMDADFSRMTDEEIYISKVIHKAVVEVNEKGSECAAATAVVMRFRGISNDPVFKANRPFMFFVLHKKTQNVLFVGKFEKP